MRKALNENPKVQAAVVAGLLVVAGLMAMMQMGGGDDAPPPVDPVAVDAGTVDASVAAAPSGSVGTGELGTAEASVAPAPAPAPSPEALIPGPGLPRPVLNAWKGGNALVLLVVRDEGIDDRLVRSSVNALSGLRAVSTFIVPAKQIARYSRITQGVGVNRVPALVVVRPRRLSGGIPEALVSYGFRDRASVVQAVDDALYSGRDNIPYHPR